MKALRKSPLKRSGKPLKRTRVKKKPRSKSEFARIYHSKERVEFVQSLPCAACGWFGSSANAHVCGNGGMGRKAGYRTIAPLCGGRGAFMGCHLMFDACRWQFVDWFPDFDPAKAATETERLWLEEAVK